MLTLWSIQNVAVLQQLNQTGKITCRQNLQHPEWDAEYRWMCNQMKFKIGNPEFEDQYPIWAWYQYTDIHHRRPDLRRSSHLPKGTNGVRIKFLKSTTEVLLSDFVLWHHPLAYKSYIPIDEADDLNFDEKLMKTGLSNKEFNLLPVTIKNEIESSWQKIFDLDLENEYISYSKNEKGIQATMWEIHEKEILEIDHFVAK